MKKNYLWWGLVIVIVGIVLFLWLSPKDQTEIVVGPKVTPSVRYCVKGEGVSDGCICLGTTNNGNCEEAKG